MTRRGVKPPEKSAKRSIIYRRNRRERILTRELNFYSKTIPGSSSYDCYWLSDKLDKSANVDHDFVLNRDSLRIFRDHRRNCIQNAKKINTFINTDTTRRVSLVLLVQSCKRLSGIKVQFIFEIGYYSPFSFNLRTEEKIRVLFLLLLKCIFCQYLCLKIAIFIIHFVVARYLQSDC